MEFKNIIYEKENGISVIKINRPQVLNTLNTDTIIELGSAVDDVEADKDIRAVIITGEGRAFAAGADISAMKDMYALEGYEYSRVGHEVYKHIEKVKKPFIAAVNGLAFGGGFELTLACDTLCEMFLKEVFKKGSIETQL